jgi:hypothetical protein
MSDRLRELDNRVLGRSVPDERPLSQQLLRPRPAVWSGKGRLLYGALLVAMFAVLRWVSDPTISVLAIVALIPVGFLIIAADERKRARKFYGDQ